MRGHVTASRGLLCTTSEFADYVLKVDFRCPPPGSDRPDQQRHLFAHTAQADRIQPRIATN